MKKILTLICCSIIMIAATSCTKNYVAPATTNQTVFFHIKGGASPTGDWVSTTNGGSPAYQVTLGSSNDPNNKLPELDNYIQHNGAVLVYLSYDKDGSGTTYEQIPENFGGTSFSFVHSVHSITITAQSPSGGAAVLPTDDIWVKVVLVDSNVSQ